MGALGGNPSFPLDVRLLESRTVFSAHPGNVLENLPSAKSCAVC